MMTTAEGNAGAYQRIGVRVEVWPVAADDASIWLLSGEDAWRSETIRRDTEPHRTAEDILAENHAYTPEMADALGLPTWRPVQLLHSPSWRMDGDSVILTYVAVIGTSSLVRDEWPNATPIGKVVLDAVGKPLPHEATEAPIPRYIDVLAHSVRHIRFLMDTDAQARDAITHAWRTHLEHFEPTLSGMYERG